ncbi:hypothetical protein OSB04_017558 [Centaurea solstitialis]|uniref:Uncharacterized protein n=1 Tax=Centaurea solstitialis TaxID=347529 RepID=A0AA38T346_9ASTR|nr:hypothetical protein OSB04_017558 [Centaurea solstitialis]
MGPGKGVLKRFRSQTSSSSLGVPQPHESSSNHVVPKGHKSSSSRPVSLLHKSGNIHQLPQPQKSSGSRDVPPPHKSRNNHNNAPPHESSSNMDILPPHKSRNNRNNAPPHESSSNMDILPPHKSRNNRNNAPPHESSSNMDILMENQGLEEGRQEDQEIDSMPIEMGVSDSQLEENIGSASCGTSITRKESRFLSETRKRRSNKGRFLFEVDECAGRIIGEDSQRFITKGGCLVREYAKYDGTTWRNQSDLLKADIINKCMENSNYDPNCRVMVRAIHTQLGNQHKNRQFRLHVHYQKFATKEDATRHPPNGIKDIDWVKLCDKFSSEEFQKISNKNKKNRSMNEVPPAVGTVSIARIVDKVSSLLELKYFHLSSCIYVLCYGFYLEQRRREGEQVSAIEQYKIGHFSTKKNKMVNEKADEIWNELLSEEADSSCSAAEICLKKLRRTAASTKHVLATENLRTELQLEKNKSKALEEEVKRIKEEQLKFQEEQAKFQEEHNEMKDKMNFMMTQLSKLSPMGFPN